MMPLKPGEPMAPSPGSILAVGEVLWDALPEGISLGGAPFNVMCHLNALGQPAKMISRIGDDELGREITHQFQQRGLSSDLLQMDDSLPTGFVRVALTDRGSPSYDILQPAAWDEIECNRDLLTIAGNARLVIFGTLAQRHPVSRRAIHDLVQAASFAACDLNLRPPHWSRETVENSLSACQMLKINDHELVELAGLFNFSTDLTAGVKSLSEMFDCPTVCVTRGDQGALLLHEGEMVECPGYSVEVVDTVGSGDAFFAALLHGLLQGDDLRDTLDFANALGAFVATHRGATPAYDRDAIERLRKANAH